MKRLYTAYLSYPEFVDTAIREEYTRIVTTWPNKRTFEFKPMIPLWKVMLSEKYEEELINRLNNIDIQVISKLKIKGYELRLDTGYVFLTFDDQSSDFLKTYSSQISYAMKFGDAEDHMPYGFEPHTSIIKQDSSVLEVLYSTLSHKLDGMEFTPSEIVISKEIRSESMVSFDVVFRSRIS